ncbi:MAG: hemerythrin domain-containing protein [Acidobacteria bacterium]|nr:hemerythrin domain-containing protein [Acidobacteriota bacterium]
MISILPSGQTAASATLDQPIEHLAACHRRIEQRLETLERAAAALDTQRDEALAAIRNAFAFLDSNGVLHTQDEEESLFPRLRGKLTVEQQSMVASLESDHQLAHHLDSRLRLLVEQIASAPTPAPALSAELRDLTARFCALYRRHIAVEDSQLAAVSRALLNAAELAAIGAEMRQRRGL